MTDKEFKKLGRAQLIEIIYQLQLQLDDANEQKKDLEKALKDKRIRLENAGNIAEAALEINGCFRKAQRAAAHYLYEIKEMRAETEAECRKMLEDARAEADAIISAAREAAGEYTSDADRPDEDHSENE